MTSAAIFDLDGTLVDTMPLHYEAYRRALASAGLDLSWERFDASVGGTAGEVIPRLVGEGPVSTSVADIHARKKAELRQLLLVEELPLLEAAKLADVLAPVMPLGLATSGSREGVELMLDRLGWSDRFGAVVTGDDVERGKPDPEPFLTAAKRLGVDATACVAFEDSDAGVASATAAGMTVFDVRRAAAQR